jgi:RNA polymerase sigma-70 factor, ECF subfamily
MAVNATKLLLQHRFALLGFIRAHVRHGQDAEDVFQEVAEIIVQKLQAGEQVRDFRAWSHEIARLCVLRYVRRQGRAARPFGEELTAIVDAAYLRAPEPATLAAEAEALRRCLERLPARNRALLERRFVADESFAQIAAAVGATEAAVRRAVSRARLALSGCVERRLGRTLSQ